MRFEPHEVFETQIAAPPKKCRVGQPPPPATPLCTMNKFPPQLFLDKFCLLVCTIRWFVYEGCSDGFVRITTKLKEN